MPNSNQRLGLVATVMLLLGSPAQPVGTGHTVEATGQEPGGPPSEAMTADGVLSVRGALGQPDTRVLGDGEHELSGGIWPGGLESDGVLFKDSFE